MKYQDKSFQVSYGSKQYRENWEKTFSEEKNNSNNLKDFKHPIQPIGWDETGKVIRFKKNKIVRFLLDNSPFDLNKIALMNAQGMFGEGDYTQLMQLIGYSVSGYGDLSTSPEEIIEEADRIADEILKSSKL